MEQFITITEISKMLNLNKRTVMTKVKKGIIPAYKVGKVYRIKMTDFQEYLDKVKLSA